MGSGRHAIDSSGVRVRAIRASTLLVVLALAAIPTVFLYAELAKAVWAARELSLIGVILICGLPVIPVLITATRRSLPALIGGFVASLALTSMGLLIAIWYLFNNSGGIGA
jgi:hypothetical protein